jgi:DNA-binding MarR family transcriptional regulator
LVAVLVRTRREHPDDRRAKLVSLTAAGRVIVRTENNVPDPVPEALAALSPREVKVLAKIFDGASGEGPR